MQRILRRAAIFLSIVALSSAQGNEGDFIPLPPVAPSASDCSISDCVVSAWSDWTSCTKSCGGGIKTRARTATTPPCAGDFACPPLDETVACNTSPCGRPQEAAACEQNELASSQVGPPIGIRQARGDCVVSAWTEWSECSASCFESGTYGQQIRTRQVQVPATGGRPCPSSLKERRVCNQFKCPGATCEDDPNIARLSGGFDCRFILFAATCDEFFFDLAQRLNQPFPDDVPPEARVRDGCRASCGLCEECAPGCELWERRNLNCEAPCNVASCNFDDGDCQGDCEAPDIPTSVRRGVTPVSRFIKTGETYTIKCPDSSLRFLGYSTIEQITLTCLSGGRLHDGGAGLTVVGGVPQVPSCVPAAEAEAFELVPSQVGPPIGIRQAPGEISPAPTGIECELPDEYRGLVSGVCEDLKAVEEVGRDLRIDCSFLYFMTEQDCTITLADLLTRFADTPGIPGLPPTVPSETTVGDICPLTCRLCREGEAFVPPIVYAVLPPAQTGCSLYTFPPR
ncbi:unnamed protein product [Vitrella brassicaformis CCMP3155]|uniref:Spondin-like TSP1 domain-containing protein n=2 Tax=Vitrella brassicaformis TaxID=1169539 RepID=A0A0G4EBF2_VITBC|nr:unnamed protein product [Vitrella brassicaformis CCMP3155]|eukprot:CEL92606.1 unnamed protein product [Vitrella brassicaformis CCMP3155]